MCAVLTPGQIYCNFCPFSRSVRLEGDRLRTAIFNSHHRLSIGLRSGLWLGHSETLSCFASNYFSIGLAVWLRSLSKVKVNLLPSLESHADRRRFSSNSNSEERSGRHPQHHDAAATLFHWGESVLRVMLGWVSAAHTVLLQGQKATFSNLLLTTFFYIKAKFLDQQSS